EAGTVNRRRMNDIISRAANAVRREHRPIRRKACESYVRRAGIRQWQASNSCIAREGGSQPDVPVPGYRHGGCGIYRRRGVAGEILNPIRRAICQKASDEASLRPADIQGLVLEYP